MKSRRSLQYAIYVLLVIAITLAGVSAYRYLHRGSSTSVSVTKPVAPQNHTEQQPVPTRERNSIWSGYIADGATFQSVQGRLEVPRVTCPTNEAAVAFWVGYDANSTNVEQTGITADCSHPVGVTYQAGEPSYYAWWMMYGVGGSEIFSLQISTGDTVEYKVAYQKGKYVMTVANLTTGKQATHAEACSARINPETGEQTECTRGTVEWIIERSGYSPLANFGSVQLYDNTATVDGVKQPIGHFSTRLLDISQNTTLLDRIGSLSHGGAAFTAQWLATGTTEQY